MPTRHDEVLDVIRRIVESETSYRGTIDPESDLSADLGLDSASRTIVLVGLEEHYEISLDVQVVEHVRTVEQLIARVVSLVASS